MAFEASKINDAVALKEAFLAKITVIKVFFV